MVALVATTWFLSDGAATAASSTSGVCSVPAGARHVTGVAGVEVWSQKMATPASVRRQYGAGATYPRYSGCAPGHLAQVLFRDYLGDPVGVRIAGDYVGLVDRGGIESLYLANVVTGRTTSTSSFTPSVQDNGGSEANEPGPLLTWKVTARGWLVYLDTLSDLEGFGTALVAFDQWGATTLDLAASGSSATPGISDLVVKGKTVSWHSSFSGNHHVTLRSALLPGALPKPLPSACQLVPQSLASELLGPLAATNPPPPPVPLTGFWPRVRTGTNRSGCAYASASATDSSQTIAVAVQRVTQAVVKNQQRAINNNPRDDGALVLPGITAVLRHEPGSSSMPEDLRMFINGVEVDITTNSARAAGEIEAAGLAIERALHDAPGAASHV